MLGVCLTGAGPGSDYLDQRQLAWFDRYLRGKQDTDTGPKFAWIADDAQVRSVGARSMRVDQRAVIDPQAERAAARRGGTRGIGLGATMGGTRNERAA